MSAAHGDSTDESGRWLSVDVAVFLRLISQVPLSVVANDQRLLEFASSVENGPSVQPVSIDQWAAVCALADMPKTPQSG